ncbi:hypothetical protein P9112_002561 [Eukaryota sp. TZLM1-RC]
MPQKGQKIGLKRIPSGLEEPIKEDIYEVCSFENYDEARSVYVGRTLDSRQQLIQGSDFVEFAETDFVENDPVFVRYPNSNFLSKAHIKKKLSQNKFLVQSDKADQETFEVMGSEIAPRTVPQSSRCPECP